ncbi:MAG: DUF1491 family protein [Rhodospirillales bacterium]|jgi:hypothetical protein|nr:DUF1491 family protein [Rhodospirillales bacterium]HJN25737.1 DUF1491 family protein [Rhodospirillales bacterium]|tara:strand:- start:151 stop:495 length:345 start_codon:yes stop_codon:yes gene_type:complete
MSWTSLKIKAGIWIQAQIRVCDQKSIPIMVRHKGDPDSGAILLKLYYGVQGSSVLSQVRDLDGNPGWMYGGGGEMIPETDAESYIQRQIDRDPDLWVIEIEDPQRRYELDGDIV